MLRKATLLSAFLFCCSQVFGETYWVAVDGNASAKGYESDPFASIEVALKQVGGGNAFIFKPGVYVGRQIILSSEYKGTPEKPTMLKSQYKYKAILHGSPAHNIDVRSGCNWVIIDGFDIGGAVGSGVLANADYTVVRNCRIHNNGINGIGAHGHDNIVIENNLIEYNGHHPQYLHGVYVAGKNITIRNNIVRHNSGWGLHLYPRISGSVIENNLVCGNHLWGISLYSADEGSNRIANNTIVQNGGGLSIVDGKNEIVVNNIIWNNRNEFTANSTEWPDTARIPIKLQGSTDASRMKIDYNLCVPSSEYAGQHGISANPLFLDPFRGVYYLKHNSPAIGKGSKSYAPTKDFFNRAQAPDKAADLGCFWYDASLLLPKRREAWYYQWPYYFKQSVGPIPDLWELPSDATEK